jgi:hypothetical protein
MANPLDSFRNLKGWQQAAVVVGGGATVAGLVVYEKRAKAAQAASAAEPAPATAAAAGTTATAGEIEDPTTGQFYPDDSVDPETGLTYQQEITEYGSVSAADQEGLQDQGELQDETPEEYEEQIGGAGGTSGTAVSTNAQWMAEVESGLSEQGYSASDIGQGIAGYFAGKPLGTSPDGTNLYTMMNLAVSEYGPPPTGSYPLLNGGGTSSLPGTGATVTVPNVTGKSVAAADSALTALGLVPGAHSTETGTVNGQTPGAGKSVASGSTVDLSVTPATTATGGGTAKAAPSGLSVTPTASGFDAAWSAVPGATSYVLDIQGAGGKGTGTSSYNRTVTGTHATGEQRLAPGKYKARVQATGGPWSAYRGFTATS